MKIKITEDGYLEIERAGAFTPQFCPMQSDISVLACGDWCPMFGEPKQATDFGVMPDQPYPVIAIKLCHNTVSTYLRDFEDGRQGGLRHGPRVIRDEDPAPGGNVQP